MNDDSGKTAAIRHHAIEVLRCQPDGTSRSLARHRLFSLYPPQYRYIVSVTHWEP